MSLEQLLHALADHGIKLSVEGDHLAVDAPGGELPAPLREALLTHKAALKQLLAEQGGEAVSGPAVLVARPESRHEPFPMTELQQAYSVGRQAELSLNASMHAYNELDCHAFDPERFEEAWNQVVARHEMLRAVEVPGFQQRILPSVPRYLVPVEDLRGRDAQEVEARLLAIRERLSQQVHALDRWPLFELRVCLLDGDRSRLFMSIDGTFVDGYSFQILYRELVYCYRDPEGARSLPVLTLSYRDYALAVREARGARHARSLEYWRSRLAQLPPAPDLPLEKDPRTLLRPRFRRWFSRVEAPVWHRLKQRARTHRLTEPELLLAVYAEVIARWSRSPRFTLNVPHFNRLPVHPQVNDIIGTFASFTLVEVDHRPDRSFVQRALAIREQLLLALEHREVSGVELLRELFRAQGRISAALMPVVMTSFASHSRSADSHWVDFLADSFGALVEALTQTPQVWIDLQIVYQHGGVFLNWDVAEELFPPGMVEDMFAAFRELLQRLADDATAWTRSDLDLLPAHQRMLLARVNETARPLSGELLHTGFFRNAARNPEAVAVAMSGGTLTYGEVSRRASRLGRVLRERGAAPGCVVAVVMEKGWEQVVAVLGVLSAGAAYLPIDASHPLERRAFMMENGGAALAVTQPRFAEAPWPPSVEVLVLTPGAFADREDTPLVPSQRPEDLAHILYTSGSTGQPNGAMLTHAGMVNAIEWTHRTFGVGPDDRVIALSALHHDFSVYDILGTLAAGATVVLPDAERRRDPSHWAELMARHGVTIWSTVPAMMEMLLTFLEGGDVWRPSPLRLAMLGGDWIPVTLPGRLRARFGGVKVVSVGGPTETSLWNITHLVDVADERRRSIPYGRPIANTRYYVLDEHLEERPLWVPGELCCAGIGVAQGYVGAGAGSAKFTTHPRTGERIYRTGDLGRYLPDGTLEFLGRVDFQLSIRGQRIEPGEIEASLVQAPGVRAAVVGAVGEHHERRLVAYVVLGEGVATLDSARLREFLSRRLPEHMVPAIYVVLASLPLTANAKVDRRALPHPDAVAAAKSTSEPRDGRGGEVGGRVRSLQEALSKVVGEVLGVEDVHPDRNFFELGANSVHLIQLHVRIKESLGATIPVVELFGHPTVRALARYLGSVDAPAVNVPASAPVDARVNRGAGRDIAIIGMGGRFPGAPTLERYWRNLVEGVESVDTFTDDELVASGVGAPAFRAPRYVRASAVLEGYDTFDAGFFSLTPREARALDPQQRVFLECAWEALEDAGHPPGSGDAVVGVYAGKSVSHYRYPYPDLTRPLNFFQDLMSQDKDFLATQTSYKLDLRGPSVNLQTACSTSLVAVAAACDALLDGRCDLALAGGVAIKVPHKVGYLYEEGSIFASDGHCRPFDARASGTIPGSGAGVVVLKRLERALTDGDRVLAVIKGAAVNNDGHRKVGFMAPGLEGQTDVVRRAHQRADVDPGTISYVEAHGTGTAMGDPIEVAALTRAFGGRAEARSVGLGSVKSNIGHLDSAAGIAGLIKVVLALQHRTLPPSLHFEQPNPRIDFGAGPFFVVDTPRPWTSARGVLRAGVSSFGIGGTNAHVVLEEAPAPLPQAPEAERSWHVLTLSAKGPEALTQFAGRYQTFLASTEVSLADVCFSANTGRLAFEHRLAIVAETRESMGLLLGAAARGEPRPGIASGVSDPKKAPRIAFLFSGQGAQYVGVARALAVEHPGFRRRLEAFDSVLRKEWGTSLFDVLYPAPGQASPLDRFDFAQPLLFALEYALAELWLSWGIRPEALLGHSTGELAAACIAGVFSVDDGLKLALHRGRLMHQLAEGANLAVSASEEVVRSFLETSDSRCSIAALNGPDNVVVSGLPDEVAEVASAMEVRGFKTRRLNIPRAAHSALVDAILPEFRAVAASLTYSRPTMPIVSGMTGALVDDAIATPDYWCAQLRDTVRFSRGVEWLYREGVRAFVEVGPKATLLGMAARCVPEGECAWLQSLRPDDGGWRQLLESLASLFVQGAPVDWAAFDAGFGRHKVGLPTYPFQRQRYWEEGAGLQRPRGESSSEDVHPLLGSPVSLALLGADTRVFESVLAPSTREFLGQHRVFGTATLPATAYVELALAAGARLFGTSRPSLSNLALLKAMTFPEDAGRRVQCAVSREADGSASVRVFSRAATDTTGAWELHATGSLVAEDGRAPTGPVLEEVLAHLHAAAPIPDPYLRARESGVDFGPEFRGLSELRRQGTQVVARVGRPAALTDAERYLAHPALLDACLQVVGGAYPALDVSEVYVPTRIERVVMAGGLDDQMWSHAVVRPLDDGSRRLRADVSVFGPEGRLCVRVEGLELLRTRQEALRPVTPTSLEGLLYTRRWESCALEAAAPAPRDSDGGPCLILSDRTGLGERLARTLEREGRACMLAFRGATARKLDERTFELPESPEALAAAMGVLSLAEPPSDVVLLWGLDGLEAQLLDGASLDTATALGCGGGLGLLRGLMARGHAGAVWLVTRGAQPVVSGDPLPGLAQASLWGLARPLAIEASELNCRCVDLDPEAALDLQVEALARELRGQSQVADNQVAFRGGRFVARLRRVGPADVVGEGVAPLRADASYLVAGGLGRLGLLTAEHLASRGARTLVLTGRSVIDARSAERLERLREQGVRVEYRRVDLGDDARVERLFEALERELPPLAGVFHSAGVLDDGIVQQQRWERFERVLRPKVRGAWNLHRLTARLALDHFVLFSSVASLVGSAGQANHCAATSFEDALAHHRRALGLPGLSINWGVWAGEAGARVEVGTSSHTPGWGTLPVHQGLRALDTLLSSRLPQVGVAEIDWAVFGGGRASPYDADLRERARGGAAARADFMDTLTRAPISDRRALLLAYLREQVAWIRGLGSGLAVDTSQGFADMGVDSLAALQLKNRLQRGLGVSLPATLVFNYPTVETLAEQLSSAFIPLEFASRAPSRPERSGSSAPALENLTEASLAHLLSEQLSKMN
ncbi:amino acid adenylation domain-containing protein [Myxococcus sp. K15C18031901]|uniref:non-ribosomal peptide synthetase/type I polyketide synthase n=1 Tax=Myxococcus dinghuensis TaxID=2906761 RepID=UPI0020A78E75|nr:non-ribosomal peptide synthetase/type I polyketide synthase [Myxococcus dinghuensis]MCP3102822.1 amino acid adenylation domain-containing protein [Myxococcus dinghuensis]